MSGLREGEDVEGRRVRLEGAAPSVYQAEAPQRERVSLYFVARHPPKPFPEP